MTVLQHSSATEEVCSLFIRKKNLNCKETRFGKIITFKKFLSGDMPV